MCHVKSMLQFWDNGCLEGLDATLTVVVAAVAT